LNGGKFVIQAIGGLKISGDLIRRMASMRAAIMFCPSEATITTPTRPHHATEERQRRRERMSKIDGDERFCGSGLPANKCYAVICKQALDEHARHKRVSRR